MERLHGVKKKGLSLLLSLAVVFGLMPGMSLPAYAEDNGWTSVTTEDGVTTYLQDFSGSDLPAGWVPFYQEPDNSTVHIVNGALTLTNTDLGHAKICTSAANLSGAVSVEVKYSYKCITDNEEFSSFIVRNDISGATYNNITDSYYKTALGLHEYDFSQYRLADFKITYSGTLNGLSNNDRICIPLFGGGVGDLATIDNLEIIVTRVPNVSSITLDAATTVGLGATKTLNATVAPANADQTVVWSSDDEDIVTVNESGVITGVKAGTTKITAKATNGTSDDSDDKTATCLVTVQKSIVASAENVSTTYDGEAHGITVNVTDPQSGAAIAFGKTEGTYDLSSSPTITNVEDSPLTVYYKITADGYAEKTGSATVTLSKKAAPTPTDDQKPTANTGLTYNENEQVLVTAPQSTPTGYKVQYSLDGTTWSTELPKGTNAGNYTVKVKYVGDGNHEDFNGTDIPVTIGKAAAPTPTDDQKPKAKDGLKYTGDPQELVTAPAQLPAGYEKVQYSIDGGKTWTDSISAGTNTGEYTVKVKYVGDNNHEDFDGTDINVKIGKKDPPAELTDNQKPKAKDGLKYTGDPQELVTAPAELPAGYEKVQYSIDDGEKWTDEIPKKTDADKYTVKVRYVGDNNHESFVGDYITAEIGKKDPPAELADDQKPKAIDGLKYTGEPQDLVTAPAELPAGYEKVQYSIDNGETWSDEIPAGTKAGDYSVKVKYVGDNNHADFIGDVISVGIVILTDERRPTAKEGLVYNGSGQQLVNAPKEDIPAPYTMKYAVTTKDEEPDDESLYDTSIPEGTDAGTYYVWYKVVGDENNNGVAAECITVSIAHKLTKVPEVPATCEKTGVKQHWKDEVGTLYKDTEGKKVTTEAELKIPAAGHSWDKGKVTKKATTKATGIKTYTCTVCKATKTESIPKLKATIKPVLVAKGIAKGKTAVNISWNKIKDADRYEIFISKCNYKGKKYSLKKVKTVNAKTLKWTKKKLRKNTAYKFYVVAQKKSGKTYKTVAKSYVGHFFTGNERGELTNPKSLSLKKSTLSLKNGKSAVIKASVAKVKKNKKLATSHAAKLRFTSNNKAVATVNAGGKVTAKAKGTATIYVQTINGIWKTCKVTVK